MRPRPQQGFTLVELMVVVAILGALAVAGSTQFDRWQDAATVRSAARTVEAAFTYARGEAVRSGNNQIVFFQTDIDGADLEDVAGDQVPILVLDDGRPGSAGQNCDIDPGEPIHTVTLEGNVDFGVTASTAKVNIDDGATDFGGASTFAQTGGAAATWVLFQPDGMPRAVNAACALGALGTGAGGIYLSNAERDVAVILTPLGASRVFAWNGTDSTWK